MKYEPMLRVYLRKFCEDFGYDNCSGDYSFERFINNLVLSMHQPGATSKNSSLLEIVSVGGGNDMGIDGLAIKVNDIFVTSIKEIDNILDQSEKISTEFIFIQSKNKDKIDSGEYAKFCDGIYSFLSESCYEPHNDKISDLLDIKNYIFSDYVMMQWKEAPKVKSYFAIMGEWRDDDHINGKTSSLQARIDGLNDYCEYNHRFLGLKEILSIYEEINSSFQIALNVLGSIEFEELEGVKNSLVILCRATDLIKLLETEEGLIRRTLFFDNVRDFQGKTIINNGMEETILNNPSAFLLLNNGITIVCSELHSSNRKVTIANPQIVNGCQTSYVLYGLKNNPNLEKVCVLVKIIATENGDITNSIIQGTNSQNPVFTESFEITRDFHKKLEQFIIAYQNSISDPDEKIYYERRSKQYDQNSTVKKYRVFGVELLAHYMVGIFFHAPHDSVLHIGNLLKQYSNAIFVDNQSLLPYYTAAYLGLSFEKIMHDELINRKYDVFKFFILALVAEKMVGHPLNINNQYIDNDCVKILDLTKSNHFQTIVNESIIIFDDIRQKWIYQYGKKYKHGIKDNPTFSKFMFTSFRGGNTDNIDLTTQDEFVEKRGTVISTKQDRAGRYYGFIQAYPENVFFHEEDNPKIDFSWIIGKTVTYYVTSNNRNGKLKGIEVRVIDGVVKDR